MISLTDTGDYVIVFLLAAVLLSRDPIVLRLPVVSV